ncbi:hypothetical protein ACH4D4_04885 [Streptomyces pristinaespiralis]|uniref:hypothetical protein n=1 Tax=Streptomyces pristinaespiralis TaxID=38300 RepID=UPI00379026C3
MSTSSIEKVNGTKLPETSHAESWARAGIADAEAEAIRARTAAEVEARRVEAEAKAEAIRITAREEAEKQRLANDRAALRFEREKAEQLAKIAEANRKRAEEERLADEERKAAEAAQQEQADTEQAIETATGRWRKTAKGFYALCAAVALPVQMAAFYKPDAKYLLVAPVFIELIALVALVGAAAAVTAGRPHWHYRIVAWGGALTAATINIVHGLEAFDAATAFGTALASIAGPGMWDLHEHGRIAHRDGKPTWRERRAAEKAETKAAAEKAAADKQKAAAQEAAEREAKEAAAQLASDRERYFPKVWEHAVKLAADLGEVDPNVVWERAKLDVEGAKPGESADVIRTRNAAQRRVLAARSEAPGEKPRKVTSSQIVPQVPNRGKRGRAGGPPVRGVRRKGDTTFSAGARKQQSITARTAVSEEQS